MDIICLPETYLDPSTQLNDNNLEIPGYNLVSSDRSSNSTRGASIYYKTSLPFTLTDICFSQECICFEVMIGEKRFNFVVLYRSQSQNQDEFDSFSDNFVLTLEKLAHNNPLFFVVLRDLNAISKNLCPLDKMT